MSAYSFTLGFLAIILTAIIWLPLSYCMDLLVTAVNSGVTTAAVREGNIVMGQAVYYSLFFVILAIVLYIIKTKSGEEEGDVVYVPVQNVNPPGRAAPRGLGLTLMVIPLVISAVVPGALAQCSGESYYMNITNADSNAPYILLNDTAGVTINSREQLIFCNATANYLCYNDETDYACYQDTTKVMTDVDEGDSSDYLGYGSDVIVWYHLNDTLDSGPNGINLTAVNSPTPTSSGQVGGAYQLVRADLEYFTTPDSATTEPTDYFTLCAWTYSDSWGTNYRPVADNFYYTGTYYGWSFYYDQTGDLSVTMGLNNYGNLYMQDPSSASTATWYHVCLRFNGTGTALFRDTEVVNSASFASDTIDYTGVSAGLSIGSTYQHIANNFDGILDEVVFFHDALSDAEIIALYNNTHPDGYSVTGAETPVAATPNITLTLGVDPSTLYNTTSANFSIYYNESSGNAANITINVTSDGSMINNTVEITYQDVAANTTLYYYVAAGNYSKHDNITLTVNITTNISETDSDTLTKEIQNSLPTTPSGALYPTAVIIGDNLTANVSSTDGDGDTITYWYLFGWINDTNITSWKGTDNLTILQAYENDTLRAWFKADDGEGNSSAGSYDMIVTHLEIEYPVNGEEYIGDTLEFSFNFSTETSINCYELLGQLGNLTTYGLGYISTGLQNNSRYVWYDENNTYRVSCYSREDPTRSYNKSVNFTNYFANWSVSIYTENDWDTPLNITGANLSIFITCEGGSQYVYNFSGITISGVKPECDVQSITAKVDYPTDSYARERSTPDCLECDIRMYMVDALVYTVLQIPIYMSDYNYWDTRLELYKLSGGNHYTIAQGYFDVERKYVTYLTKDNSYYLRLDQGDLGSQVRDIGFLYAATATSQYLSLSEININPTVTLISDNLLMAAEFDNISANTSTLRITYEDLMNLTTSVRVRVYSEDNTTAWYDNTYYGYDNLTISLNNINTTRHTVHFDVLHEVLGNSPVAFTIGVGGWGSLMDFGLSSGLAWLYPVAGFVIIFFTVLIIVPEIRLPGLLITIAEFSIFYYFKWFETINIASIAFMIAILVGGIVFEIKFKGVT